MEIDSNVCGVCNKGGVSNRGCRGNVLLCSGSGCSVAVHENCLGVLGVLTSFDEMYKFHCPFCAHKYTLEAGKEEEKTWDRVKEEISLSLDARKEAENTWEMAKERIFFSSRDLAKFVSRYRKKGDGISGLKKEGDHVEKAGIGVSPGGESRTQDDLCSDHGGAESTFGDKSFDEPTWGTFDTNNDTDSVWGFNLINIKEHGDDKI